ncbi:hypothetical protein GT204_08310 [Streptomyces sp. SID4919]|uniref:hypothetical protein n=1 Tax=unclassified Streptomyces TaxID=2593676 RepID=UPI0011828CF0|nr:MULTISPECIES: hypothetical protein [unclassified Streptomyces]MYY08902.1 hypothetical protein [Streptomyces sp. SID4919]
MEDSGPRALVRRMRVVNPPMVATVLVAGAFLVAALVGLAVDTRTITGQPAWAKPARFAFSFGLFGVTLIWLMSFVRGHGRLVSVMSWTAVVCVAVEGTGGTWAAAEGTTSHFNFSTVVSATRIGAMLVASLVLLLIGLVTVFLLLRGRVEPPALAWALRLGMVVTTLSMVAVYLMVQSTPAQEAAADPRPDSPYLGGMPYIGAHTVGPPDGGPGMSVSNFSTVGGDWRVPHFVGVHSLQVLCLLGLLLTLGPRMLGPRHRTALVWIAGGGCLALTGVLTWQAHRGQPFTAPDTTTGLALTSLAVTVAMATAAVFLHARATRRPSGAGRPG